MEKSENAALAFSCGQLISILSIALTPSPHPSTSNLWLLTPRRLITTTTTTMVDYMLVFVLQKILSLFLLCSVSPSTVCLYTARRFYAHAPSLLCFLWISSATYRPGIWTKACWAVYNGSIWTQIFLKRCQGRRGKKDCFGTCGHGLSVLKSCCQCIFNMYSSKIAHHSMSVTSSLCENHYIELK